MKLPILILMLTTIWTVSPEARGQSKNTKKIEIEVTIIARERLYGHIYDSKEITPRLLVVRVEKVLNGRLDSEDLLVYYKWRLEDKDTPLDGDASSKWRFKLSAQKSCERTLREIQFVEFAGGDGGILPRFNRSLSLKQPSVDFQNKLPCYRLERGDFSPVDRSIDPSITVPTLSREVLLVEDDLWLNPEGGPIKIDAFGGGRKPTVFNVSSKNIRTYTLGCVLRRSGGFTVSRAFPVSSEPLEAGEAFLQTRSDGTNRFMVPFKICRDLKSVLSVIEVEFSDGSFWRI